MGRLVIGSGMGISDKYKASFLIAEILRNAQDDKEVGKGPLHLRTQDKTIWRVY
jgi:hypothetical protein